MHTHMMAGQNLVEQEYKIQVVFVCKILEDRHLSTEKLPQRGK